MKKKEQFSIALWDRLKKDNIPHSFESRVGTEITQVIKFDGNIDKPITGVYMDCVDTWGINGVYYDDKTKESDLFIVWEEEQLMLEGWLNVYGFGKGLLNNIHETKEKADTCAYATMSRIACVKVSIPYTKGEGLNNG